VFGLPGTKPLSGKVDETADAVRTERAVADLDVERGFAETRYRAGSWGKERRAVARIEATRLGLDIRFVVTNLDQGSAEWLYETSTAPADRRKISSSCTKPSSPQIVRPAGQPAPTRFASSSTPPPSG
jgi:Transposase DDE domain group 1